MFEHDEYNDEQMQNMAQFQSEAKFFVADKLDEAMGIRYVPFGKIRINLHVKINNEYQLRKVRLQYGSGMSGVVLSRQTGAEELRQYFETVQTLQKSGKHQPIDLDDVWPLAYSKKDNAMRVLRRDAFIEGDDFTASKMGRS